MSVWAKPQSQTAPHAEDALTRLLASEDRVAARLDAARSEAEETLRVARQHALDLEAACDAMIEARTSALRDEHETGLATEIAAIKRDAAALVARFDANEPALTRDLVAYVLRRVLDAEGDPRSGRRR